MLKLNKKGFALVETLIVSVFVATIFTIMYTNFFPMFGEYERRESYDDIDSIYRTHLIKKMFEYPDFKTFKESQYKLDELNSDSLLYVKLYSVDYTIKNEELSSLYTSIEDGCNKLTSNKTTYCTGALSEAKVANIYLTKYNLEKLKTAIKKGEPSVNNINIQMQDYIDSLPYYKNNESGCNYRIIVQYAKEINKELEENKKIIYGFSTIGVKL